MTELRRRARDPPVDSRDDHSTAAAGLDRTAHPTKITTVRSQTSRPASHGHLSMVRMIAITGIDDFLQTESAITITGMLEGSSGPAASSDRLCRAAGPLEAGLNEAAVELAAMGPRGSIVLQGAGARHTQDNHRRRKGADWSQSRRGSGRAFDRRRSLTRSVASGPRLTGPPRHGGSSRLDEAEAAGGSWEGGGGRDHEVSHLGAGLVG